MSQVMCNVSCVTCQLSRTITATATEPPFLIPPLSTVGRCTVGWLKNPKMRKTFLKLFLTSGRKWVFCDGTHRQTDGLGDSMTKLMKNLGLCLGLCHIVYVITGCIISYLLDLAALQSHPRKMMLYSVIFINDNGVCRAAPGFARVC